MSRPASKRTPRPPFENRYGSGEQGWRWFKELEYLGPDIVRLRLLKLTQAADADAFKAPEGFAHDWLVYRARRDRLAQTRWRTTVLILALIAAVCSAIAAYGVFK